jgi:hypothetical protein
MDYLRNNRWVVVSLSCLVILSIPIILLAGLLNYRPDTSASFPLTTPPQGPDNAYLVTSVDSIVKSFTVTYATPFDANRLSGQSFLVKGLELSVKGKGTNVYEDSVVAGYIQFMARNPADLKKLRPGDNIDVLGTCGGFSKTSSSLVVFTDCIFVPAGTMPFPLAGAPGFSGGY